MRRYISYLKYVVRHKWFVLQAWSKVNPKSLQLLYRCIMHDMSKFKPSEFIPYARTFYKPDGSKQYVESDAFNQAWNDHQKTNKHHWQYFLLKMDSGSTIPLEIPDVFIEEMICDWLGAGKAINGEYDFNFKWYFNINYDNVMVSENTRCKIDAMIKKVGANYFLN